MTQYAVFLDDRHVTTSPLGWSHEKVRAAVDAAVVELGVVGVVDIRPYAPPIPKRRPYRKAEKVRLS